MHTEKITAWQKKKHPEYFHCKVPFILCHHPKIESLCLKFNDCTHTPTNCPRIVYFTFQSLWMFNVVKFIGFFSEVKGLCLELRRVRTQTARSYPQTKGILQFLGFWRKHSLLLKREQWTPPVFSDTEMSENQIFLVLRHPMNRS